MTTDKQVSKTRRKIFQDLLPIDDDYVEYDDEDDGKTYLPLQLKSTFLKIPVFIQSMMMKSLKGSSEVMTMMTIMTTTMTTI